MPEFVNGLSGINVDYIGKYKNHCHICELKVLGNIYNSSKKDIRNNCPLHYNYNSMNFQSGCDNCIHSRTIYTTDDGNHIEVIK